MAAGAEAFASSVVSGVEGVVVSVALHRTSMTQLMPSQLKPIEGAESEGAKGFFKGVGKGLIGCALAILWDEFVPTNACSSAVTKPVIGVFDLASNVGAGNKSLDLSNVGFLRSKQVFVTLRLCSTIPPETVSVW